MLFDTDAGGSGVDTGDIQYALRFRSGASPSLNRTFATPTANTSWALSVWIKRGALTGVQHLIGTGVGSMTGHIALDYGANKLAFIDNAGNVVATATSVLRDPTSPFHIFIRSNGTNIKAYRNNEEILSYTGTITTLNSAVAHWVGRRSTTTADHFDGYMSRFCFVDNGGSLLPTDFIRFNTEINEWVTKTQSQVKAVVDAGGTNSFMLDFDNATSLTTLGYDKSSKGNNWTLNNFSLTAGPTYDHMLDVPGNSFATLNPLSLISPTTLSNANLTLYTGTTGAGGCFSTIAIPTTGDWYVEFVGTNNVAPNELRFGVGAPNQTLRYVYFSNSGFKFDGTTSSAYGAAYATNDVMAFAISRTNGTITFYKNGVSQGVAFSSIDSTTELFAYAYDGIGSGGVDGYFMFGQAPLHASATYDSASGGYFRYTPPAGYKALCQRNLPDPAILNPETGFVSVTATETNIDSTLAAARAGWGADGYLEILKNGSTNETWVFRFSHDTGNEYATAAGSVVHQANRAMSGSDVWTGAAIRASKFGVVTGSFSHTNGANTTVTHNSGVSSRYVVLAINRAGGTSAYLQFPDLTHSIDICSASAPSGLGFYSSRTSTQFVFSSLMPTGTYDYIVIPEADGLFSTGTYTGLGATTDNTFIGVKGKAAFILLTRADLSASNWVVMSMKRNPSNVAEVALRLNTNENETTVGTTYDTDVLSNSLKLRASNVADITAAKLYAYGVWYGAAAKFSLGR